MGNGGGKGREKGRKFGGIGLEEIHGKKGYLGIPREIRGFGLRRFEKTLRFEKRGKREGNPPSNELDRGVASNRGNLDLGEQRKVGEKENRVFGFKE